MPGPVPWVSNDFLEEQQKLLPESVFHRLHLNAWASAEDKLTTADDIDACRRHTGILEPEPGAAYVLGLDLGLRRDRSVLTIAHAVTSEAGRTIIVDRQIVWQGSKRRPVDIGEVEAACITAHEQYNRAPLIADPWQTQQLIQRLRGRRFPVFEFVFSQASNAKLAQRLFVALRDHALDLPADDDDLKDELANVQLREVSPSVYRLDHSTSGHDDRAVSLALCIEHLMSRPHLAEAHA